MKFIGSLSKAPSLVVISLLLTVSLIGCGKQDVDADQLLKDALLNAMDVKQQEINLHLAGDFDVKDAEDDMNGEFDFNLSGYFAETLEMKPLFDMELAGDFSVEDKNKPEAERNINDSFALLAKMTESDFYVNLEALPTTVLGPYAPFVTGFTNQWWKLPIPDELTEELDDLNSLTNDELEEDFRLFLKDNSFFKDVTFVGSEKINGVKASKLEANFDEVGIKAYLDLVSASVSEEGTDEELTEEDEKNLEELVEFLAKMGPIKLWISEDKAQLVKFVMELELTAEELAEAFATDGESELEEVPEGLFNLMVDFDILSRNEEQEIELPEDAKEFDLGALGLGGAIGEGVEE